MSYKVDTIPLFDRQATRLSKKYPSLKKDLSKLVEDLAENPMQGHAPGNNFYKIRLSPASENKGKSGGARVITFVKVTGTTVFLTCVYDKGEQETISNNELDQIFKLIP